MAWGMKLRGTHGEVIIDDTYRNLHLVANGTTTSSTTPQNLGYTTTVSIPEVTSTSLIAVSGSNPTFVAAISGTNVTFFSHNPSANFSWWVFDTLSSPSSDTWGVRVRNAANQIIFDGGKKCLKVLGVVSVDMDSVALGDYDTVSFLATHAGKTIAAAQSTLPIAVRSGAVASAGAEPNYVYNKAFYQSGNDALTRLGRYGGFSGGQNYTFSRDGVFLLIDVTGF